ncbi:MAG TPA: hypothetical protein PKO36_04120, partial [Candidatus Hydrogenedentes bacterium]|nr:hypothetical protein [Candidatus Hydrogenedentota bacterium]
MFQLSANPFNSFSTGHLWNFGAHAFPGQDRQSLPDREKHVRQRLGLYATVIKKAPKIGACHIAIICCRTCDTDDLP